MARIRLYEPYGYVEELDYESRKSKLDKELEKSRENDEKEFSGLTELFDKAFMEIEYDSGSTQFLFKNFSGETKGVADMSDIIPSDLVTDAHYDPVTEEIVITFKNGQEVRIPLEDLINVDEFGDGFEIIDGVVQLKLDESGETFLSVSENGLKIDGVQDAIDAAISGATSDISERLDVEIERAKAAEQTIQGNLDAESERAVNKETELSELLSDEVSSRTEADDAIISMVEAETDRALSAETELNSKIDNEISRATDKDGELEERIDGLESGLTNEISARENADSVINDRIDDIDTLLDALEGSIDDEASRAIAAEDEIANNLLSETTRATEEEQRIESKLDNEITRSTETDEALAASISAIQESISGIGVYVGDGRTIEVREIDGEDVKEISATLSMHKVLSGLDANVQEAYQLVGSDGVKIGDQINIYKDSSLLAVALVKSPAEWDPINREIVGGSGETVLAFAYQLAVSSEVTITEIPISQLVSEAMFKDGLQVNDNNEVSVKIDEASEGFLTVSADGVKLSGVQDAIDEVMDNVVSGVSINGKSVSVANSVASFTITAIEDPVEGESDSIVVNTDDNGNISIGLGVMLMDSGIY